MVALDVAHLDWDDPHRDLRAVTPKEYAVTVLTTTLPLLLRLYLDEGRPRLAQNPDETALFLNHRGGRLSRQGFWLIVKAIARAAGVEAVVNPRTLRHTAATGMVRRGSSDLTQVQVRPRTRQPHQHARVRADGRAAGIGGPVWKRRS